MQKIKIYYDNKMYFYFKIDKLYVLKLDRMTNDVTKFLYHI